MDKGAKDKLAGGTWRGWKIGCPKRASTNWKGRDGEEDPEKDGNSK